LPQISSELAVAFYRVAQEALRNAISHSAASQITVTLSAIDKSIDLSIVDNGRGFAFDSTESLGLGLSGMTERMRKEGGTLTVASQPGAGTTISASIQIAKSAASGK
jgi:signal transduction histidine kinase